MEHLRRLKQRLPLGFPVVCVTAGDWSLSAQGAAQPLSSSAPNFICTPWSDVTDLNCSAWDLVSLWVTVQDLEMSS